MKDEIRNTRETGKVQAEPESKYGEATYQPEPAKEGADGIRKRGADDSKTAGHRITRDGAEPKKPGYDNVHLAKHSPDADAHEVTTESPESKSRALFIKGQREAKDDTFASPSGRTSMREAVARLKGV